MLRELSDILLPMFSSRIFMVLSLTFKSLTHGEFTVVHGVSWWSIFFVVFLAWHTSVQFSQHHLLNRLPLLGEVAYRLQLHYHVFSPIHLKHTAILAFQEPPYF